MSNDVTYDAVVAAGGTITCMHRLTDKTSGDALTQSDVAAIEYTIYGVGPRGRLEAVAGHSSVSVDVASAMYDSLQNDASWGADEIGFNFAYAPDITTFDAFPDWGERYMLVWKLVPLSGPPIVWRWRVRT